MFWVYNFFLLLFVPLFPAVRLISSRRGKVTLLGRFKRNFEEAQGKILLHVSSVGEVNSVRPLVKALNGKVVLTVFTDYGLLRAKKLYSRVPSRLPPIDLYPVVRSFLKKAKPKAVVIYETEIWPSLLKASSELSVPFFFVSGKIGDRTYKRLKVFKKFLEPLFKDKFFLARSERDAERALNLGFRNVEVVGDLKLDYEPPKEKVSLKIEGERPVVVWGSTHEGEEKIAEKVHFKLKKEFPNLLTVVAPRHVGRKLSFSGKTVYRSETEQVPEEAEFYVVNTVGELSSLYRYADVAVIGGSFVKGIGGHNPVEPVAFKVPTLMGEYGSEFFEVANQIKVKIVKESEVYEEVCKLLKNQKLREKTGEESFKLWKDKRGVTERVLNFLEEKVEL